MSEQLNLIEAVNKAKETGRHFTDGETVYKVCTVGIIYYKLGNGSWFPEELFYEKINATYTMIEESE